MANAKEIIVQESDEELQKYLRKASCQTIKKRIKMLMVIKKRAPDTKPLSKILDKFFKNM